VTLVFVDIFAAAKNARAWHACMCPSPISTKPVSRNFNEKFYIRALQENLQPAIFHEATSSKSFRKIHVKACERLLKHWYLNTRGYPLNYSRVTGISRKSHQLFPTRFYYKETETRVCVVFYHDSLDSREWKCENENAEIYDRIDRNQGILLGFSLQRVFEQKELSLWAEKVSLFVGNLHTPEDPRSERKKAKFRKSCR